MSLLKNSQIKKIVKKLPNITEKKIMNQQEKNIEQENHLAKHEKYKGHISKDLFYFGLFAGLFMSLGGIIFSLMLPAESKEKGSFINGWLVGFFIGLVFYGFLFFYFIPNWIENMISSATKNTKFY